MFAPAGEGAHPAVSPLPVPAPARELQAALRVRQPAGGSQLRPQHGDLCRAEEQLGEPPTFVTFFKIRSRAPVLRNHLGFHWATAFQISKHLEFMFFSDLENFLKGEWF